MLVAAAPGAIAGTVFSVLADYRSRRVIAAGGAFGFAAALAVYGLAPSFPMLVVASFVLGCAATALCDATELALVDVSGDDAPAAVSRSHLFGAVGDLLGPVVLIVATATGIGWRGAFLVCAVLVLAYAIWIATLPIPAPRAHEHERARDGLREVVRDRRVWFCAMVALLLGPLDEPFLAFLIADLEARARHVDGGGNGDRGRLDARLDDRPRHNQPRGLPMRPARAPRHGGTPRRRGRRLRASRPHPSASRRARSPSASPPVGSSSHS